MNIIINQLQRTLAKMAVDMKIIPFKAVTYLGLVGNNGAGKTTCSA